MADAIRIRRADVIPGAIFMAVKSGRRGGDGRGLTRLLHPDDVDHPAVIISVVHIGPTSAAGWTAHDTVEVLINGRMSMIRVHELAYMPCDQSGA